MKQISPRLTNRSGTAQVVLIVFMWLLLFLMPVLTGDFDDEIDWTHVIYIWKEYALIFIMFLINRYLLLPYLLFKGKRLLYGIILGLIVTGFVSLLLFTPTDEFVKKPFNHELKPPHNEFMLPKPDPAMHQKDFKPFDGPKMMLPPFGNILIMSLLILGFDTGLVFSNKWMNAEKNKAILEKENVENKMAFLRNQISPHFFMNTLNNIHSLVDISVEEAKDSIIRLSRMMSYMLYNAQDKQVLLHKEFDFIRSYIDLMRLRFTDQVSINLTLPEKVPLINIPPLLTISFIENAFKHGISYEESSFINIQFVLIDNRLFFEVTNKVFDRKRNDENSGVGLTNSKNRLDLIYGSDYKLVVDKTENNLFVVKLNIPI